jgi:ABC-type uncharacterized transport system permease subunit
MIKYLLIPTGILFSFLAQILLKKASLGTMIFVVLAGIFFFHEAILLKHIVGLFFGIIAIFLLIN